MANDQEEHTDYEFSAESDDGGRTLQHIEESAVVLIPDFGERPANLPTDGPIVDARTRQARGDDGQVPIWIRAIIRPDHLQDTQTCDAIRSRNKNLIKRIHMRGRFNENGQRLDDAGHGLAISLQGPYAEYNLFPQDSQLNEGHGGLSYLWKRVEALIQHYLRSGRGNRRVELQLRLFYNDPEYPDRPSRMAYSVRFFHVGLEDDSAVNKDGDVILETIRCLLNASQVQTNLDQLPQCTEFYHLGREIIRQINAEASSAVVQASCQELVALWRQIQEHFKRTANQASTSRQEQINSSSNQVSTTRQRIASAAAMATASSQPVSSPRFSQVQSQDRGWSRWDLIPFYGSYLACKKGCGDLREGEYISGGLKIAYGVGYFVISAGVVYYFVVAPIMATFGTGGVATTTAVGTEIGLNQSASASQAEPIRVPAKSPTEPVKVPPKVSSSSPTEPVKVPTKVPSSLPAEPVKVPAKVPAQPTNQPARNGDPCRYRPGKVTEPGCRCHSTTH